MKSIVKTIEELNIWAKDFIESLEKRDHAIIITLSGDLGVGKTACVQEIAKNFGINEVLTSPTFVIQKEYNIENHFWLQKLIHIDAYRLTSAAELEYLKWNEIISENKNIIFMEWPEMVKGIELPNHIKIEISINEDHSRTIKTNM